MCTYNAISSHTDHYEIQKRDSEESLLTFVNLFPIYSLIVTEESSIYEPRHEVSNNVPLAKPQISLRLGAV